MTDRAEPGRAAVEAEADRRAAGEAEAEADRRAAVEAEADRRAAVEAGVVAGLAGLLSFLALHHLWIAPIWFVAPMGAVLAGGGGAVVGAAYAELAPHLPRRPWRSLAVLAGSVLVLLPTVIAAQARGPMVATSPAGFGTLSVPPDEAVTTLVAGLLVLPSVTGAGIGALVARRRRAAALAAAGGAAIAIGPGHNAPLLGGTAAVGLELAILGAIAAVASVTLVEIHALLAARRGPAT